MEYWWGKMVELMVSLIRAFEANWKWNKQMKVVVGFPLFSPIYKTILFWNSLNSFKKRKFLIFWCCRICQFFYKCTWKKLINLSLVTFIIIKQLLGWTVDCGKAVTMTYLIIVSFPVSGIVINMNSDLLIRLLNWSMQILCFFNYNMSPPPCSPARILLLSYTPSIQVCKHFLPGDVSLFSKAIAWGCGWGKDLPGRLTKA